MRLGRNNPFAGVQANNPFTGLDAVALVPIPPAPETHERRGPRRGYMAAGGGNPLDGLISALGGGAKAPKRVEYVKQAPEADDELAEELPPAPHPHGRRRG